MRSEQTLRRKQRCGLKILLEKNFPRTSSKCRAKNDPQKLPGSAAVAAAVAAAGASGHFPAL